MAGLRIAVTAIYPIEGGWSCPSESGPGRYVVTPNDEDRRSAGDEPWWLRRPQCTCPDNQIRHARCKHIAAVFRLLAAYEITMGESNMQYLHISGAAQEWYA